MACVHTTHLFSSFPSLSYIHVMIIMMMIMMTINICRWGDVIPETYLIILGTGNKGDTVLITMETR